MSGILAVMTHPVYILACVLMGVVGRKRRIGFFGFTILSFLVTPLLTGFMLYVAGVRPPPIEDERG